MPDSVSVASRYSICDAAVHLSLLESEQADFDVCDSNLLGSLSFGDNNQCKLARSL